jgi:hypothetical protein
MKPNNTYQIVKQIHLYSSLATVALLLMYIVTSYMMIYHDWFQPKGIEEDLVRIDVVPAEVSDDNWQAFLAKNKISGRLTRDNINKNGDQVRIYSTAKGNTKITLFNETNKVEIAATKLNTSGKVIGLHRMRGYGGPLLYNIYALLLDVVGLSLMLFAITGVILWMKLLKNNIIAWTVFVLGFIYVSAVVGYLVFV